MMASAFSKLTIEDLRVIAQILKYLGERRGNYVTADFASIWVANESRATARRVLRQMCFRDLISMQPGSGSRPDMYRPQAFARARWK